MTAPSIGHQYDKIAEWWRDYHKDSQYGVPQFERALSYVEDAETALDVGCGAGGRFVRRLEARGLNVTGVDASAEMVRLAREAHPNSHFIHEGIQTWETQQKFDFILAWDCLFHLPLAAQKPVLKKLCNLLESGGVLIHSFGDGIGQHVDQWRKQDFRYSSIGVAKNLEILMESGLTPLHLELDQFPEKHVYSIAIKATR